MEKYSVVIPIYNVKETFLEKCIYNLLNQTYKNLEIILVDDGSNDNIYQICEEYAVKDERIIVVHKKNGGVSSARNEGIKMASGNYITFTDSDDFLELNTFEIIHDLLQEEGEIDIIKFGYTREKEKSTPIKISTKKNFIIKQVDYHKEIYPNIFNTKDYESSSNVIYRAELIKENKVLFDDNISVTEDFLFLMECIIKSKSIYFLDKSLYHYRVNPESVSQKYNKNKIIKKVQDEINSYGKVYKVIPEVEKKDKLFVENYKKKLNKIIRNKLSLIAENEKFKDYKAIIKMINQTKEVKEYCDFFKTREFSNSFLSYIILKNDIKLRKIIKSILGR